MASAFFPPSEAKIISDTPGHAEQSPLDWWLHLKEATANVMKTSCVSPGDIAAIGISYQMHGLVALGANGHPLRNAIIWCDSRGVPYGDKAAQALGHDFCLSRLLNLPGNFTATKLAWVKEHEPSLFREIHKICLPGDYIALRLTGRLSTTEAGLSEMMLWDFRNNSPARFMLDFFGFPQELLPDISPTFGISGRLTRQAATELGLAEGIPVAYRAGDQPNNALSLGVTEPGQIAATAGTSGVVYGVIDHTTADTRSRVNNFVHVNHSPEEPRIGILLCVNGTGILNSWMKHNVALTDTSYAEMNCLAAEVAPGSAGLTILPYGNGAERMLSNLAPGCTINHLDFNLHRRCHLFRAAQEGIAFSLAYGIEIMQEMGLRINTIHAGNANMFLSKVFRDTLASVSSASIELYDTDGAAGAARGAGIGAGIYASTEEATASLQKIAVEEPAAHPAPFLEAYSRWKADLDHILNLPST